MLVNRKMLPSRGKQRVAGATPQLNRESLWRCPSHLSASRSAMTLLEIVIAAGLLGILMTISVQMLRVMGDRQRAGERRAAAMQTVQALSEQLGNMPWVELTAAAARDVQIPDTMQTSLPGGKIDVEVVEDSDPVAAKRVMLELSWDGPRGRPAGPIRLTTWVYPDDNLQE